jgi:hypothetical protein
MMLDQANFFDGSDNCPKSGDEATIAERRAIPQFMPSAIAESELPRHAAQAWH